jgi:hypothetical protein
MSELTLSPQSGTMNLAIPPLFKGVVDGYRAKNVKIFCGRIYRTVTSNVPAKTCLSKDPVRQLQISEDLFENENWLKIYICCRRKAY